MFIALFLDENSRFLRKCNVLICTRAHKHNSCVVGGGAGRRHVPTRDILCATFSAQNKVAQPARVKWDLLFITYLLQ